MLLVFKRKGREGGEGRKGRKGKESRTWVFGLGIADGLTILSLIIIKQTKCLQLFVSAPVLPERLLWGGSGGEFCLAFKGCCFKIE